MGFLSKIFGGGSSASLAEFNNPKIRFGRYTDLYKTAENLKAWDQAKANFDKGNFVDSFENMLNYLKDDEEENVKYTRDGDNISFEILQGSKQIIGTAGADGVTAKSQVVGYSESLPVAVTRKLVELNYGLYYSGFAMDDAAVSVNFRSPVESAFPNKFYHGLKELARTADKQDDILLKEFPQLTEMDNAHVSDLPAEEKAIKIKFLRSWIETTLKTCEDNFDANKDNGPIAYYLLSLIYRVDYLLAPEGTFMNRMEKIQNIYYGQSDLGPLEKAQKMIEAFREIESLSDEEIGAELYKVKSTFGLVAARSAQEIGDFINSQQENLKYYVDQKRPEVGLRVMEFMSGYLMFNFGVPEPTMRLNHLYQHIVNIDFFQALGFDAPMTENGKLNEKLIRSAADDILEENKTRFPKVKLDWSKVNFKSLADFSFSFYDQIKRFDYSNSNN